MSIGRTSVLGVGIAIAVVSSSASLHMASSPTARAQEDAKSKASRPQVHALGRVEPSTGLIVVGSRPGARIVEIRVSPGDAIKEGQVLAVLEGHDQAEAQLALAELQKAQAEHRRATQKEKFAIERAQLDAAHAARLATATQVADILKKKFDESSVLYKTLGGTLSGRDKLDADSKYIELQIQSLRATLDKTLLDVEQSGFAKQRGLEDEQLAPSNPEYQLADRQIELARAGLAQTEVTAPRAGTVLDVLAHAGEVGSGPLLRMGDLSAMVVVAEVYQTDVARLRIGDRTTVDVLGKSVAGKVERIGSIVGRNQIMNIDPRSLQDLRVVDVRIALDDAEPASHLINLEAEVAITPGGGG